MRRRRNTNHLSSHSLSVYTGFSPLDGYMDEADYKSVVNDLKLTSGLIFGLPVVYDTSDPNIVPGKRVLLKYNKVRTKATHIFEYLYICAYNLEISYTYIHTFYNVLRG